MPPKPRGGKKRKGKKRGGGNGGGAGGIVGGSGGSRALIQFCASSDERAPPLNIRKVRALLDMGGADVRARVGLSLTALMWAINRGPEDAVKAILEVDPSVVEHTSA